MTITSGRTVRKLPANRPAGFLVHTSEKFYIVLNAFLLIAVAVVLVRFLYSPRKISTNFVLNIFLILSALGILDILDMFFLEPNWISVERVKIRDEGLAGILEGLKVVQISDIHLKELGLREKQLIGKVNQLKPDILFITGDFFGYEHPWDSGRYFGSVLSLIKSLRASVGVFGVLGNYDGYLSNNAARLGKMRLAGIDILQNESRRVLLPNGNELWLAGSTYDFQGRHTDAFVDSALAGLPPDAPVILMNHYPDIFGKATTAGVNLVLAGHTHGGQIGIPFLVEMSHHANKSPYMKGLFDAGKTKMYVNRGIGTTNIPVRFLCRPEITVFDFVS